MKKNLFKLFICLFVMLFTVSSLVVSAKRYELDEEEDENPGGVTVLTINETDYYVEIEDETGIAYVCVDQNGNVTVLGTCQVVMVDRANPNGIIIGEALNGMISYGNLVLVETEAGVYVSDIQGNLGNYFSVGDKLIVTE